MDNEMIERVAEALTGSKLDTWHPNVQAQLKEQALNVIKTMREPTEKMLDAGADIDINDEYRIGTSVTQLVWQSMIDSITND